MPRGLESPALRDPLNFSLAEWQKAKRIGADPREIKSALQECWAISDSRTTFEHALRERGFWLARGDRRGFVAIDYQGEVYSLSRTLNCKAKDLKARLGKAESLPGVDEVKRDISQKLTPQIKAHIGEARRSFQQKAAVLSHAKTDMRHRHRYQRQKTAAAQKERADKEAQVRAAQYRKGLGGLWDRVTGRLGKIKQRNEQDAKACARRDQTEKQSIIEAQLAERQTLQHKVKAQRERQTVLLRSLRQDMGRYVRMGREQYPQEQPKRQQSSRNQSLRL